ncbi:MAG: multidrug effflux MFS transporter [Bdellovibrionales bacterium]|nr:multidrug effflux MFS transporter [Bdellovibrionales bacterium]
MSRRLEASENPKAGMSSIPIFAALMALGALSLDSMLPALEIIGKDLSVKNANDVQFIISFVFVGMGFGLAFFGPLSDTIGRKPAVYIGIVIFLIGNLVFVFSLSFSMMFTGRFLQGLGGASCRVVIQAMIRDQFSGRSMAKVMSIIMIVFVLVPALAPSLGQLILSVSNWQNIFFMMFISGALGLALFYFRQAETLDKKNKKKFSYSVIKSGVIETLLNRISRTYLVASGVIFGAFVGYLSSAQQIFQHLYNLGNYFALIFGILALVIGLSSFTNSFFVEKYGMRKMCTFALMAIILNSMLFIPLFIYFDGHPHIGLFFSYLVVTFSCIGVLFGNFNAMAMEPLGHIAGVANSVISSLSTLISVSIGASIGFSYDQTVLPLSLGFFVASFFSFALLMRVRKLESLQSL